MPGHDHHDHHDHHHEPDEDTSVPDTSVTAYHPRTRIDPHGMYDVADPTRLTPAPPVSPIGAHTRGAAATTPPVPPAVSTLNAFLDDRDRIAADTRAAWAGRRLFRTDRRKVRTVREVAARRAEVRLRHERHLEILETVRAYLAVLCLVGLFLLVIAMAVVSFMILSGQMVWAPTRV